jgi:FkbH-like protein
VRLADTFGDNGMISVLICRRADDVWDIDTWLMSCRVLGRRVEQAVLAELVEQARMRGVRKLMGSYLPTEKNQLVENHYEKLGFALLERIEGGGTRWQLDVDALAPNAALPMRIERLGFEAAVAA